MDFQRVVGEIAWRDQVAAEKLGAGNIVDHTSGEWIVNRTGHKGWLYFSATSLVFIADMPIFGQHRDTNDRIFTNTYSAMGGVVGKLFKAPIAPNAMITFGNRVEIMGAKRQMKVLYELANR